MDARTDITLEFARKPSAWRYMLGALRHSYVWQPGEPFPRITAHWRGWRADTHDIADFMRLAGTSAPADALPVLFLHAIAFRLQMVVLTHPAFAVPIWRVLQVRNQLVDVKAVPRDAVLDFETRILAHRVTERGLEVDLQTRIRHSGELVATSLNTFYVRGRFGEPAAESEPAAAPAFKDGRPVASWHMAGGGGVRFGALTGDYNGIHLSTLYARVLGFRRAFFHPLRVAAQALARAGVDAAPPMRRFDLWLKGPVFHDSDLELLSEQAADCTVLAVYGSQEVRPAIVLQCRFR